MSRKRRKPGKGTAKGDQEQFIRHPMAMLMWAEWQKLGIGERRFLDRLELELVGQKYKNNGRLTVSHRQFEAAGVRRRSIGAVKARLTKLGLMEVMSPGRAHAELRDSGYYRLTYLSTYDQKGLTWKVIRPTNEWKRLAEKNRIQEAICTPSRGRFVPRQPDSTGAICTPEVGSTGAICTTSSRF